MSFLLGMKSAKPMTLEPTAPKTKPTCTPIVSQAERVGVKAQSSFNCGMTAVAENQVVIESNKLNAKNPSTRHLIFG
jgi:hypothetical protein